MIGGHATLKALSNSIVLGAGGSVSSELLQLCCRLLDEMSLNDT